MLGSRGGKWVSQGQQGQGVGLRHLGQTNPLSPRAQHSSLDGAGRGLDGQVTSHSRNGASSDS